MPTPAERRALVFAATIAVMGVVARLARARDAQPTPTEASVRALDAQIARVDSIRRVTGSPAARAGRATGAATKLPREASPKPSPPESRPVDLDVADAVAIERLPWIGPALAARIVEYRQRCGAFGSLEGLTRVRGIGEVTTRRLAPHVTFSGRSRPFSAAVGSGCQDAARGPAPRGRGRS